MLNDINAIKNSKILNALNIKEIGNINITVYREGNRNFTFYYLLPDKKELMPIVDLLDDTLANNSFSISENLEIKSSKKG